MGPQLRCKIEEAASNGGSKHTDPRVPFNLFEFFGVRDGRPSSSDICNLFVGTFKAVEYASSHCDDTGLQTSDGAKRA